MPFKEKRVIVTGGTRGLGKAIALSFARQGAWVASIYASDDKSALNMESALKGFSARSLIVKADVALRHDVQRMFENILGQWEHVDILVNNAGIIRDKLLMFLGEEDWDRVIGVNLKGTYLCSRAVIKSMIGQRSGRIINITSPSALMGREGQTNYAASKGGIISFTKSLSREMARLGITVNAVCPGLISTPMTDRFDPETKRSFLKMIPIGRFGEPEEVAGAVLFLASQKAGYITGQVLAVDGGLT
ncbi:MAG: 3-oxoacyl-[acyl-carrier-protein] reductase [Deltaproteobacteria bacterium]|nr:3-oxoacyl-[acyl-carrier-protein] reductase [Deltaproteobacteria bacterium]